MSDLCTQIRYEGLHGQHLCFQDSTHDRFYPKN